MALKINCQAGSLAQHLPAPDSGKVKTSLVGVASRWPQFLDVAHTMLLAAGVDAEALIVRDAREPGWAAGLETTTAVVCDCATAQRLPRAYRALVFRLVAGIPSDGFVRCSRLPRTCPLELAIGF